MVRETPGVGDTQPDTGIVRGQFLKIVFLPGRHVMAANRLSPATPLPTRLNGVAQWTIPAVIDQYRLLRPLGWGGTGIVYEAEDMSLGRRVAIKLIPHEPGSEA